MNDNGTGKPCPDCGAPMVGVGTRNERWCIDCNKSHPWNLDKGQKRLINSSRGDRKK